MERSGVTPRIGAPQTEADPAPVILEPDMLIAVVRVPE
jgi:hypothetical protein